MEPQRKPENLTDTRPSRISNWRLLLTMSVVAFAVLAYTLARPAAARAAWAGFTRIAHFERRASAPVDVQALAKLPAQEQAETLLEAAVNRSNGASAQITMRAAAWRGRLTQNAQLTGLVNTALNSQDIEVRTAAIEVELSANNLPKDSAGINALITRMERQPASRPWGLWMLGALGNRGIEPDRAFTVLAHYSRDRNEHTRFWAVEGLAILGSDQSVSRLLEVLHTDSSSAVRERAASGLAKPGMLSEQQRAAAVPALIEVVSDSAVDSTTHTLTYEALRAITGATVHNDPQAWRSYWAENSTR
jgi:HEAT repeat protein